MKKYEFNFKDYTPIVYEKLSEEEKESLRVICGLEEETSMDAVQGERCVCELCDKIEHAIRIAKNTNLLLVNQSEENRKFLSLFSVFNGCIFTQGYCGTIELYVNDLPVTVNFRSRFDDENSNFLMYVFQKAFHINGKIYDEMNIDGRKNRTWDFLLMVIFVRQLHDAMKKGMYRQYQEYEHNDFNVKGRIDVSRHIKENGMLSNGKVCYVTREYTVDNHMNRLFLKAFQCLRGRYRQQIHNYLLQDDLMKKGINFLKNEVSGWREISEKQILKQTGKKIVHNVYKDYEPLRKTSIAILKRMGVNNFVHDHCSTTGMLIDMPGLWERFLHHTIFSKVSGNTSPYRQQEYPILDQKRVIKPDFLISGDQGNVAVVDAKYKMSWSDIYDNRNWEKSRNDVFQVLSYMYCLRCDYGGIIFPHHSQKEADGIRMLNVGCELGDTAKFMLIPYDISSEEDVVSFYREMDESAERMVQWLRDLMQSR